MCVIREYFQFLNKHMISEKGSHTPEKEKNIFRDGLETPVSGGEAGWLSSPKAAWVFQVQRETTVQKRHRKLEPGA